VNAIKGSRLAAGLRAAFAAGRRGLLSAAALDLRSIRMGVWEECKLRCCGRVRFEVFGHRLGAVIAEQLSSPLGDGKEPDDALLGFDDSILPVF